MRYILALKGVCQMEKKPTVMLLDASYSHALQIAAELKQDLDVSILGIGSTETDALFRSKYCDDKDIAHYNNVEEYAGELIRLIRKHLPDMVIPVGYRSVKALGMIRDEASTITKICLPPSESLDIALDKKSVLKLAKQLGIEIPVDYSEKFTFHSIDDIAPVLPYPVFLKASQEAGKNITGLVKSKSEFIDVYRKVKEESNEDTILIQEFVDGNPYTYGCGVLFINNTPVEIYCHEELKSVPRTGGSATKIRLYNSEELKMQSITLLSKLNWNGIALVEFKKRKDGTFVLMEVNPKFWASYSLASKNGYRFASLMVSETLGIPHQRTHIKRKKGTMVFPIREISYVLENRETESLTKSVISMLWPPAKMDVNITDLKAWIPVQKLRRLRQFFSKSKAGD
ncbi:MAG TPA: hypothetical protein P5523_07515 [Bacteroidales bacterium]|nr:hypothetical protein [Bacteroidales bacterium]